MTELDMIRARLESLEIRVMHQDQVIEDLNATTTDQWRQIAMLTRQISAIDDRLRDGGDTPIPPLEAPPPHY